MHVEQENEVDIHGDSNVHRSDLINVLHAAHKEKKDETCGLLHKLHKIA